MTQEEITRELENVIEKYKDKYYHTGEIVVPSMARSCLNAINDIAADRDAWKARAEKAESRADRAIADIRRLRGNPAPCLICEFNDMIRCCHADHCTENNQYFKWHGEEKK